MFGCSGYSGLGHWWELWRRRHTTSTSLEQGLLRPWVHSGATLPTSSQDNVIITNSPLLFYLFLLFVWEIIMPLCMGIIRLFFFFLPFISPPVSFVRSLTLLTKIPVNTTHRVCCRNVNLFRLRSIMPRIF